MVLMYYSHNLLVQQQLQVVRFGYLGGLKLLTAVRIRYS